MRSLLFVPGDSEKKLGKIADSEADAILLDLEDSVSAARKPEARRMVAEFLAASPRGKERPRLIVRVNAFDTPFTDDDLAAVVRGRPDAILLPKAGSGAQLQDLSQRLALHEADAGLEEDSIAIHALITETARGMLNAPSFANKTARLEAIAWGAEDLAADVGASANRDDKGVYTDVFRLARTLTLLVAADAGVDAIDTVFTDFRDNDGLERECRAAVRDGFSGKMAIHPGQVATINAAFTPPPADVERARQIIALFAEAGPDAGVLSLDGKMIDMPHLRQAERVARRAGLDPQALAGR
ncbi:CoA ester lyase [Pseudohoeflea sp. DP4N28-3]|uniref:CoA ester lyase n=1 Tax=Pseudohoeflea coraliihabitans TaxID=2860393 RepID=A0ABS6WR23_9HYPH|nr:CoA ester lyase [Pseudohoeflea sp. DP4N28-3]MBW3098225.1 CoA ester lyase [Pseudohoeflea sp. DP4N28-3]